MRSYAVSPSEYSLFGLLVVLFVVNPAGHDKYYVNILKLQSMGEFEASGKVWRTATVYRVLHGILQERVRFPITATDRYTR